MKKKHMLSSQTVPISPNHAFDFAQEPLSCPVNARILVQILDEISQNQILARNMRLILEKRDILDCIRPHLDHPNAQMEEKIFEYLEHEKIVGICFWDTHEIAGYGILRPMTS